MDWPEATIELPQSPVHAIEVLETLLEDTEALERRRLRNVAEAARRHDTRRRLHTLFVKLDVPVPDRLADRLKQLDSMADRLLGNSA